MPDSSDALQELLDNLNSTDDYSMWLYFVTRHVKEGIKKTARVVDKYDFVLRRIDLAEQMEDYFKTVLAKQIEATLAKGDLEMLPYTVIGDDLTNRVYTYALNNALSFSDVITNQLPNASAIRPVDSLHEIKDDIWAYCFRILIDEKTVYSFRKTSIGKIATDEPQNTKEKIMALFDSSDAELKLFHGELIRFDNKIDCIYLNEQFYVFKRSGFEAIVGLEEEFTENANSVVSTLRSTGLIAGIEILDEEIDKNRTLLKTLSNIAQKQNHENFDSDEIEKMKDVLARLEGRQLKTDRDGKILLEDTKDLRDFVRLLNDYYKQGMVSGKYYGSNAGEIISASNN